MSKCVIVVFFSVASSTKQSVSGSSDFLGKGCVTSTAMSFMTTRGFSRSFFPFQQSFVWWGLPGKNWKRKHHKTPNHSSLHGLEISSTKQKGAADSTFALLKICSLLILCMWGGGNNCLCVNQSDPYPLKLEQVPAIMEPRVSTLVLLLQSGPFLFWGSLSPNQHICYLNSASAGGKLTCQELSGLGASTLSISGIKALNKKMKLSCCLRTSCKSSTCGMKLWKENVFSFLGLLRTGGVHFTWKLIRYQSNCQFWVW